MRVKEGCVLCFPDQPIYLQGDNWRIIVAPDEPNHYLLAPKEHLPCTGASLARSGAMFEAIEGITWPMEIVVHLNGFHLGLPHHLHIHLYRRE